ncbi:hypothetical protein SUDANB145_00934 [Streptomyces sp. enrichment culture]|uniref:hypothetical protein n=1 Tax=Streptomyces sp. enrichment culture TaxID=1795815 RepID=UPI003F55A92A
MTHSTTTRRDGPAPSPAEVRAERRRLVESVRALRRLLGKRPAFEIADRRRLNREKRDLDRAAAAHAKALRRAEARRARQEGSLTRQLAGLDGKQQSQEQRALAVLRRESVARALSGTRLDAREINGIGTGLVRDLAAHGIRTAADFDRVSWGKAPGGRGGQVLYIHRTQGGRVHINGIGEHRGRPLMAWREAAVARAEARAPRTLPPDERHRIAEIIEAGRARLRAELAEVPRTAEAARAEAGQDYAATLDRLGGGHRAAADRAAERRAEFDAMAEQLRALQAQLAAHRDRYGDAGIGRRIRRAQTRALRPAPEGPPAGTPVPSADDHTDQTDQTDQMDQTDQTNQKDRADQYAPAPGPHPHPHPRPTLLWLIPIVFLGLTALLGVGEPDATAPAWFRAGTRLVALAATVELLRLWLPRRRRRTTAPLPPGTGPLTAGAFFALLAAGILADADPDDGAGWAAATVSLALVAFGAVRRVRER